MSIERNTLPAASLESESGPFGVTPLELYMRQNNLCWLVLGSVGDKDTDIFCTDGTDYCRASELQNPTIECSKCFVKFVRGLL